MSTKISKILDALFVSKVRIKALEFFCLNPEKEIHLRGIVKELDEEVNSVRRVLGKLSECGFLKETVKGNRKYFELNGNNPLVNEVISMFHKANGLGKEIIESKNKLGNIEYAFLTPNYTKGIFMGLQIIDLVVIGDVNLTELANLINNYQTKINREIHYMVLKSSEFLLKKRRRDQFIIDLLMQDNVLLIGNRDQFVRC
ncbi:hypothetical protein D6810_01340 [Candidatus Dojkabacteria bacterium]|uniref:ArsR family transcriptional regulator n=1 Tax=Candidatus Dojkabacteria bacterium TaxID=2099670 RepID=A0A3M0Z0M9_9BACT|nr:MAG: hypothetical protein D6810_01340 [Candidatus Dojkabacteria bacterium]